MSKDFVREFIELYRNNPCLWRVKSKQYKNRDLKNAAYEEMHALLMTVEEDATVETAKKKINSLRTCYRKELKKVLQSTKSGCSADDVYQPALWYFPLMEFLRDQETPRPGISNIEDQSADDFDEDDVSVPDGNIYLDKDDTQSQQPRSRPGSASSCGSQARDKEPKTKAPKKNREDKANELMTVACQRLATTTEDDEFTCVGNIVANKLRKGNRWQRIFAKKLINDILFAAQLNALTAQSALYP